VLGRLLSQAHTITHLVGWEDTLRGWLIQQNSLWSKSRSGRTGQPPPGASTPARIQGDQQPGRVQGLARWAKPSLRHGSTRGFVQEQLLGYGRPSQRRVRGEGTPTTTLLPCDQKQHRPVQQGTFGAQTKGGKQKVRRPI